jgi:hypothetical protein
VRLIKGVVSLQGSESIRRNVIQLLYLESSVSKFDWPLLAAVSSGR